MKTEESRPNCLTYDATHRRLVTAVAKPYVWVHKMVAQVGAMGWVGGWVGG